MTHFRFLALLSLDPEAQTDPPPRPYPSGTHDLMIRASSLSEPSRHQFFPAAIYREDGQALTPGDSEVVVAVDIDDDEVGDFFGPGQQITLWNGHDCGRGVISRRVFTSFA